MDLLARREHSFFELKTKLLQKNFNEDAINQELHRLVDDHLLDDSRFTESFLTFSLRKGKGPLRIESELQQRGVSGDVIQRFLLEVDDHEWIQIATDVLKKKLGTAKQVDYDKKLKLMRFLSNRGFTNLQVIKAIKTFVANVDDE